MDAKVLSKALRFDGDTAKYAEWRKLVGIWSDVTNVEDAKKGSFLILQLQGKALKTALTFSDRSLANILAEFDKCKSFHSFAAVSNVYVFVASGII